LFFEQAAKYWSEKKRAIIVGIANNFFIVTSKDAKGGPKFRARKEPLDFPREYPKVEVSIQDFSLSNFPNLPNFVSQASPQLLSRLGEDLILVESILFKDQSLLIIGM
jgi:hypothetical protein